EAILVAADGTVTEGTSSSLCIVRGATVSAHPNGTAILPGITRDIVFGLAADLGIATREQRFGRDALLGADEVFLCGTGAEVTAVATIDGETIGDGAPGPVTQRLLAAYHAAIDAGAEP
ncbi:MAG: aminotransferase class IV, partial [Armatimonadetes bacterium]|nr:aminotransferase class IV [Armatimonadota bacterium]